MKQLYKIISISLIALSCKTLKNNQYEKLLKEYAFCKCVESANEKDSIFKNDISKSIYIDIAHYNLNTYLLIDSIAHVYALSIKPSIIYDHQGKRAIFLKCFEFFNSKTLDSLIKQNKDQIIAK